MLTPNELLHISEGAEEIAESLHQDIVKRIIERIMLRIGRGEEYLLTSVDKWQIETLQEAGFLLEDIQKEIAKKTRLQEKEIAEAMEDAGVRSLEYDDKIYRDVGLSPVPLLQSPELMRIAQRNYEATMGEFTNFTRTIAEQSQQLFISECDKAYNLVSTGALGYTQAVKEAVDSIVKDGVIVTYPSGHKDTIETATLRAVRTGIAQMSGQMQLKRMEEMQHDKVIISSHLGARPSHALWQGKVFTMEQLRSTDVGMPAYGTVTGLHGANCRHSFSPFFEGMEDIFNDYDSEENQKQYDKEQRQRTLERRIRKTKREVMGLKESVDNCKDEKLKFDLDLQYQKKSYLLSQQTKSYNNYCASNNLRPLADRISIAKWDRQQASSARGASKRYENAKTKNVVINMENQKELKNNIQNITIEISPNKTYKELSLEEFKKMKHSITSDERKIIYGKGHFSGYINSSNARKMNEIIRNDGVLSEEYQKIADTLQDVINKNKLQEDIIVTRYVTDDALEHIAGVKVPQYKLGSNKEDFWSSIENIPKTIGENVLYTEKAFLSTSGVQSENVMQNKGVKLEIKVPKGKNCYISTNNKESEIIFGKGTNIKIIKVRIENNRTANRKVVLECVME